MSNKIAKNLALIFVSVVFVLSFSTVETFGEGFRTKMPNGAYFPGIILFYDNGDLRPAKRSDVVSDANYYVLIHGAKENAFNCPLYDLAPTILEMDANAQLFFVDWSFWSNSGVVSRHLIKQTEYIPRVASRAYQTLFDTRNIILKWVTGDWESPEHWKATQAIFSEPVETGSEALGLDPARTHIIGRSHGAHVGGLICKDVVEHYNDQVELLSPKVKRLSAIDPSARDSHLTYASCNWNADVAELVDVYRLSTFCCDDHIYGHFNLSGFSFAEHPDWLEVSQKVELFDDENGFWKTYASYFKADSNMHNKAVEYFNRMCRVKGFLKASSFYDLHDDADDEFKWIVIE